MTGVLLGVEKLSVGVHSSGLSYDIVRDVTFDLYQNEILAVVGESGCGKSLTALSILSLQSSPPLRVTSGAVMFGGKDLLTLPRAELRKVRGKEISMIFQDPMSALDPMFTVGTILTTAVRAHQKVNKARAEEISLAALADAGIEDPRRRFGEYAFQLSGGISQRVMIALALVNNPKVIIADEPTTALDVTVQAQILERLSMLKKDRGMSIILITHNLGVVASVADRVAVMYSGEIVETGSVAEVFRGAQHPYTHGLLRAVPRLGSATKSLTAIPGRVPQPTEIPAGCVFAPRCERVTAVCHEVRPALVMRRSSAVRCHNPID
jgi:peptide/nickel transport system ATP-binding protein